MIYLKCGDCLELMKEIPEKSIDMILCDLPYGTTQCKWDTVIPFEPLWVQYNRIIKENGAIVLFATEPFASRLRMSNIKNYKYDWVWDKVKGTGFLNAKRQPMRNHELICVFYKKQCVYNPQMTHGHILKKSYRSKKLQTDVYGEMKKDYRYESTDRYPRSIQVFSTDTQNSSLHPTQKPVALTDKLNDGTVEELVSDAVTKALKSSIEEQFAWRGEARKVIDEKVKEVMTPAIERVELCIWLKMRLIL